MIISQYDIVLVNLDPTVGSEGQKTRPCVVISPDEMNRQLNTIVVAPMTSVSRPYPSRVSIFSGGKTGWVMLDQVRTIDRLRVVKVFAPLVGDEINGIKQVIKELYVD